MNSRMSSQGSAPIQHHASAMGDIRPLGFRGHSGGPRLTGNLVVGGMTMIVVQEDGGVYRKMVDYGCFSGITRHNAPGITKGFDLVLSKDIFTPIYSYIVIRFNGKVLAAFYLQRRTESNIKHWA